MRFIDLFAGLGGFHLALRELGHECVFASEVHTDLRELYERNFGMSPAGDIRDVEPSDVPKHDIVCAGFPCQPFSKAGSQYGFEDAKNGGLLIDSVLKIVEAHRPSFVLLENVPNLSRHRRGATWATIRAELDRLRYDALEAELSPHEFGIPQIRQRLFIAARPLDEGGLSGFTFPKPGRTETGSILDILDMEPADARPLSEQVVRCLEAWQAFIRQFPAGEELPSFPIWSMEFGATYPYEDLSPHALGPDMLRKHKGHHGSDLSGLSDDAVMAALPSHARREEPQFPKWKRDFIRQNRTLYKQNVTWIDHWMPSILEFPSSFQKLEWNCKGEVRDIWRYVLQLRPSGVRVKRPSTAPSLVAMTSTQVPIIAWERRYITTREAARLQSIEDPDFALPDSTSRAFEALGNAVNVSLVRLITERLLAPPNRDVHQTLDIPGSGASTRVDSWSRPLPDESVAAHPLQLQLGLHEPTPDQLASSAEPLGAEPA